MAVFAFEVKGLIERFEASCINLKQLFVTVKDTLATTFTVEPLVESKTKLHLLHGSIMECHEELNSLIKSHPDQNLNSFKLQALFDKHEQLEQSKSELDNVFVVFFLQKDLLKQTNLQKNFLTKIYTTIHIIAEQKTVN